jgi:MFS transporter, OFA family, oxalate/formate antiporter
MFGKKIFYGWYIVAASLLIIMLDGLLLYSFGVFLPYLNEEFAMSRAEGSAIFSFRALVLAPAFIIAGRLIDKFDPRAVIFGGGVIAALGMIGAGFATNSWELYLTYGFFVGLGDAVLYITCVAIISRWFVKKRAFAIGIITTGVPLSGLITNPLTAWLINDFGVRNALFILGTLMIVVLLSSFVMRSSPEDLNMKPYGEEGDDEKETGNVTPQKTSLIQNNDWTAKEAISTSTFWTMYGMYLLAFITFLIIVTQFYNFEIDLGIAAVAAAGPPAAIGVGSIIGRTVLTSLLAEVLDYRKVILICFLAQGSAIILLLIFKDIWVFYLFGLLFGFFYSAVVPLFPTMLGKFFGLAALGTIYGVFATSYSAAGIIGPIVAGYIYDLTGTYFYPFLLAIICCYLAALGAFFIKEPRKKVRKLLGENA